MAHEIVTERFPDLVWGRPYERAWGPGPWEDEPDRVEWRDDATGLPCLIRRHPFMGQWCGYVAVPPGHALHGVDYDAAPGDLHGASHGELTFAGPCMEGAEDSPENICHVPRPGEPANVWWFGFDCAHGGDLTPGLIPMTERIVKRMRDGGDDVLADVYGGTYRTTQYVKDRCTAMALVLAGMPTASVAGGGRDVMGTDVPPQVALAKTTVPEEYMTDGPWEVATGPEVPPS